MLRAIMEARYSMAGSDWDGISKSAKSLIHRLLQLDPAKRLTAAEGLGVFKFYCAKKQGQKMFRKKG